MKKSKFLFLAMSLTALSLAACNQDGQTSKSSKSKKSGAQESYEVVELPKYNVVINGGAATQVEAFSALTKPADPTAPAGKKFYGWKNIKNGGQIWDFDKAALNKVMEDVELVPCYVDANLNAQFLEAEACPDLLAFNGEAGKKMPGSTYSGGQSGKGLVYNDVDDYYGVTTIDSFDYYETEDGPLDLDDPEAGIYYFAEDVPNPLPAGKTADDYPIKERKHKDTNHGAFIHYMYVENDTLTWEVESSEAATNVQLFARFSGEYGHDRLLGEQTECLFTFSDQQFKITVNDQALSYGSVTIHNVISKSFIPFQDFELSTTVSLQKGSNKIQMKVTNHDVIFGTVGSTAPCVDSIKLYSTSTITWNKMNQVNIIAD